ncbi:hypothetical protein BSKO_04810 [Bryopsis sp. KO-2023]|nr:hypothetical protein BSKO_04810 [Bryopsis sp. KO-2023]
MSVVAAVPSQVVKGVVSAEETVEPFDPAAPFKLVQAEIDAITERLRLCVVETEIPVLAMASKYLLKSGCEGKRLRPAMSLLLASALDDCPPPSDRGEIDTRPANQYPHELRRREQRVAEMSEVIHVASLLHDDVIDDASTRRGIKALNLVVGNKISILAGDFLLARLAVTMASCRNTEVIEIISGILEDLVAGEIMQMTSSKEDLVNMDYYFSKTYRKTASLMSRCCRAVAVFGGHPKSVCDLAAEYGKNVGMAFQIIDDILDFTASSDVLGKPALNDVKSGLATAPVLLAMEEFPELKPLIIRKFRDSGDVEEAVRLVEKSKGIQRARKLAEDHAKQALEALKSMPAPKHKHGIVAQAGLVHITEIILKRKK